MAAIDNYPLNSAGSTYPELYSPLYHIATVSPDDNNDLTNVSRGISFTTAGALAVVTAGGESVTITNGALAVGVIHPLRLTRIKSSGTGAGGIMMYW